MRFYIGRPDMACSLRIFGSTLDVDSLIAATTIPIADVYRRGERTSPVSRKLCQDSGLTISISEADFSEFEKQVKDAISFLNDHKVDVARMAAAPGVDGAYLDFSVTWLRGVRFWKFPRDLIVLLNDTGLALDLSFYPVT
jgi:hypothetical protein